MSEEGSSLRTYALNQRRGFERTLTSHRQSDVILRSKIIAEVELLKEHLIELKTLANRCTPLLSLPPEVIREIGRCLADIWSPVVPHCTDADEPPSLGWISLTHVCKTFRDILIGYQALWSGVVLTFPKARSELLQRAGATPLSLRIENGDCSHRKSAVEFFIKHISKARDACIVDISEQPSDWLLDPAIFLGKDLLFLESLELNLVATEYRSDNITDIIDELPVMVAPRLRSLILQDFYVPFNGTTLSHLELGRVCFEYVPSSTQFIEMLHLCFNIETLILKFWIPPLLVPATQANLSFPYMARFSVEDMAYSCHNFDTYLSLPPTSNITFHPRGMRKSESLVNHFKLFERHFKAKAGAFQSFRLTILHSYPNMITLSQHPYTSDPLDASAREEGSFTSSFWVGEEAEASLPEAMLLIPPICTKTIRRLDLGYGRDYLIQDWVEFLQSLTHVDDMRLTICTNALWYALSIRTTPHPISNAILLPALTRLEVSQFDDENSDDDTFLRMIISRRRAQLALQSLHIKVLKMDQVKARGSFLPRLNVAISTVECISIVDP